MKARIKNTAAQAHAIGLLMRNIRHAQKAHALPVDHVPPFVPGVTTTADYIRAFQRLRRAAFYEQELAPLCFTYAQAHKAPFNQPEIQPEDIAA